MLSRSALFCPVRCVVLLCRRNEEPLRPIRGPKPDASVVFADAGIPGREAVKVDPLAFAEASLKGPPGAGKEAISGS